MLLVSPSSDINSLIPIVEQLYSQVFRQGFIAPGFVLLGFDAPIESHRFRKFMIALKEALADRFYRETGRYLVYRSLARFNQQVTTKFHLDGAPPEAYLMLGYEPSVVPSSLAFADYTRAAFDWGITPTQLLTDFNPMFGPNATRLVPYVRSLADFDPRRSQIVLVNNSSLPFDPFKANSLGVMHQATILQEMPDQNRVINSTMLVPAESRDEEVAGEVTQKAFVETQEVAGEILPMS